MFPMSWIKIHYVFNHLLWATLQVSSRGQTDLHTHSKDHSVSTMSGAPIFFEQTLQPLTYGANQHMQLTVTVLCLQTLGLQLVAPVTKHHTTVHLQCLPNSTKTAVCVHSSSACSAWGDKPALKENFVHSFFQKVESECKCKGSKRLYLSLIHIWRCRRKLTCRSRWSPYH